MSSPRLALRLICKNINLPTSIKTAIFPNEQEESMVISTQCGEILKVDNNNICRILDIRDKINSKSTEDGLLGLEFHSNFTENGYLYIYYTLNNGTKEPTYHQIDPNIAFTLNQSWNDRSMYHHENVLEEWRYFPDGSKYVRSLLRIKQPFYNNNGVDNLTWDHSMRGMILSLGDGGGNYDPFNLSQNNNQPHGKLLAIYPELITRNANIPLISRLSELDNEQKKGINILAKGLHNPYGITTETLGTRTIKYLANTGQDTREGVYAFDGYYQYNGEPINFGWRSCENGWPTTMKKTIQRPNNLNIYQSMIEPVKANLSKNNTQLKSNGKTHRVNWNLTTDFSKILQINQGDSICFISDDGYNHTLCRSSGPLDWDITQVIIGKSSQIGYIDRPDRMGCKLGEEGVAYYVDSFYPKIMRLIVIVQNESSLNNQNETDLDDQNSNEINGTVKSNIDNQISNIDNQLLILYPHEAHPPVGSQPHVTWARSDKRLNKISGTKVTGVVPYNGDMIKNISTMLVMSELNISQEKERGQGAILLARPDRKKLDRTVEYTVAEILDHNPNNENRYYVKLGTNIYKNRLFLATYGHKDGTKKLLGTVFEIIQPTTTQN